MANVLLEIPVHNTRGLSFAELIRHLTSEGIKLDVTAIFTEKKYDNCLQAVEDGGHTILSVFAG